MFIIAKIFILLGLIKLLDATNQPFLCSGIYTGILFILGLISEPPFLSLIIGCIIAFGLSSLYFWLLDRFQGSIIWWIIFIGGLLIGLV